MKNSKTPILILKVLLVMLTIPVSVSAQQQPQYSQFMFNNLVINPAYAGADEALSLTMISRNQWTGVEGAPTTQSFAAHTLIPSKKIGLGLTVIHDKIGVHSNLSAQTNYAYHIRLKRNTTLSFGLQVGITSLQSDYSSLANGSNDPKLGSIDETVIDFGSGIFFRSPSLDLGVSAPQLLNTDVGVNDTLSAPMQRMNIHGYGRYRIHLGDKFQLEPSALIKYFPETPLSFDVNVNLVYKQVLTTGVSYRKNESLDLLLKFQLTHQLQVGYAYDYPLNTAALLTNASHELMIHYVFRTLRKNIASPR